MAERVGSRRAIEYSNAIVRSSDSFTLSPNSPALLLVYFFSFSVLFFFIFIAEQPYLLVFSTTDNAIE